MKLTEERVSELWKQLRDVPGLNDVTAEGWLMKKQQAFARTIESEVLRLNGITGDGRGEARTPRNCGCKQAEDCDGFCRHGAPPQQAAPGAVPDGYRLMCIKCGSLDGNHIVGCQIPSLPSTSSAKNGTAPKPQEPA